MSLIYRHTLMVVLEEIRNTFPSELGGVATLLSSFQCFLSSTKHSNSGFFYVTCFQSLEAYRLISLSSVFPICPCVGLLLTMVLDM